jgi:hypothetical protein
MKVVSLADLERDWSIVDCMVAHEWLNEFEDAEATMRARQETKTP